MQIVYISNRPQILLETIKQVALFMPFVERALVCLPDAQAAQIAAADSAIALTVVPESAVLTDAELDQLPKLDHQTKNYLLRNKLACHPAIENSFIMSDDDSRPLRKVALSRYLQAAKHHRYFFYDLKVWPSAQTEFDAGQHSTFAILQQQDLPSLSYASHMPQIIDRQIFIEAGVFFREWSNNHPVCEWSSYFNYAASKYPDLFHPPSPYLTLCWPEHPRAWPQYTEQGGFLFENYTPACYRPKGVFASIFCDATDQGAMSATTLEKTIAWQRHRILSVHPEQTKGLAKYLNPRTWLNKLASPYN